MQSSLSGQYKCGIKYEEETIYSTATSINVAGMETIVKCRPKLALTEITLE